MPANSSLAARRSSTLPLTTLMSALSPAEALACGVACQGSNGTRFGALWPPAATGMQDKMICSPLRGRSA
jgi:hypothetical protein